MDAVHEYLIWDRIVESAKTKFDYNRYKALFSAYDDQVFDKILFHVIAAFASGEEHQTIATNLCNELSSIGFPIQSEQIDTLLEDKHVVFSGEIYATYLAFSLLEEEENQQVVFDTIQELLQKAPAH